MRKCKLASIALAAFCMSPLPGNSTNYFTEGFDDITQLSANGWSLQNLSGPPGTTNWFQPDPDLRPFDAYDGAPVAYIGANFNNAQTLGTISNWLMTPVLDFGSGATLTFYTRKVAPDDYYDRLEVRVSTNGASTNAGNNALTVGDFTTLKLSINPTLIANVYPTVWTQYTITGLPHHGQGRIAFRYYDVNNRPYSDFIGIDRVVYSSGQAEYQVGGNVDGLGAATGVTLQLNGENDFPVAADGTFQFPAYVSSGTSYSVTVSTQPGATSGLCGVTNGKGVMGAADVANVAVSCDGVFINAFEVQSLVQDGGFETGTLSRYWVQASTNFGANIYNSSNPPPRTGSFFAWFGGTIAAETSSIQQAGVIAAGSTTLDFHVWWATSVDPAPDPDAYFKAKIDGNTVFSLTPATASAYNGGYTPVSVDISAYADGKNHVLRFESNNAAASDSTSILLDDVSIAGP